MSTTGPTRVQFRFWPRDLKNLVLPKGAVLVSDLEGPAPFVAEMTSDDFETWVAQAERNPRVIEEAGLHRIEEVLTDTYDHAAIARLLESGFDAAGLNNFPLQWFPSLIDAVSAEATKAAKVRRLMDYAEEHGRVHHILTHARNDVPKAYAAGGPYHRQARRLPAPRPVKGKADTKPRKPLFDVPLGFSLRGAAAALGVSFLGAAVYAGLLALPWSGVVRDFTYFFGVIIALMGVPAGDAARRAARENRGKSLAILASIALVVGYGLAGSLVSSIQFIIMGFPPLGPLDALFVVLGRMLSIINPPGTLTLAMGISIYFTWRGTR